MPDFPNKCDIPFDNDVVPVNFRSNLITATQPTLFLSAVGIPGFHLLSGALVANTYKTILEINSKGTIQFLANYAADVAARTIVKYYARYL